MFAEQRRTTAACVNCCVGFKVAATFGRRYLDLLELNEPIIAKNVTENLYSRHIAPVFLGSFRVAVVTLPSRMTRVLNVFPRCVSDGGRRRNSCSRVYRCR